MSVYRTLFACHCVPSPFSHAQLKDGRGQKVTSCYCPSGESQISHIFFLFIKKIFTILVCESFRYKRKSCFVQEKNTPYKNTTWCVLKFENIGCLFRKPFSNFSFNQRKNDPSCDTANKYKVLSA